MYIKNKVKCININFYSLDFSLKVFTITVNPRDWVQGCDKPRLFGAKASQFCVSVFFAPLSSLTFGRGAAGYKTGIS